MIPIISKILNRINNLENKHTYSTDEQVIGKWIDGKNIYRKTFCGITTFDGDISGHSQTLVPETLNIDKIINYGGYLTEANGNNILTTNEVRIVRVFSKKIVFQTTNEAMLNSPYAVILEYTKTTD